MDLHDKIKRSNNLENSSYAPFRQNGADRGNYTKSSYRQRNPNRQAPRSVQYQPEAEEVFNPNIPFNDVQEQGMPVVNNFEVNNMAMPSVSMPSAPMQQQPAQQEFNGNDFFNTVPHQGTPNFNDTVPATPVLPNFSTPVTPVIPTATVPIAESAPAETPLKNPADDYSNFAIPNVSTEKILQEDMDKVEKTFYNALVSLFDRYEIDKVLIVENKIYTVNFTGDEDAEIFEEALDEELLSKFSKYFVADGYFEALLVNGCKLEMTYRPVSELPTIIVSKPHSDFFVDEEFISILFEFLSKGKNVVMLSNFAIDTMYKIISDFFNNNLCITINEPIKTENNVAFRENPLKPSLKTVYSMSKKIEPDNTLVYSPTDLLSTISYMKKNNSVVLFSETDTPSDFINADVIHALGGQSEYNRISILKAVDIIFTVVPTKNGTIKYTATQLLSPTNKSHVNKIKKIIGDAEIDLNKIYFNNVFEKEI